MSIFGGVEPPRWLQEIAKPIDTKLTGQVLGTMLGGAWNALQPDPEKAPDPETGAQPTKGFQKGLFEARMNQQDPQWKLKEAALTSQVVGNWLRNTDAEYQLRSQVQDDAVWMTEDRPAVMDFQQKYKTDPETPLPVAKSSRGQKVVDQIGRNLMARENVKLRDENSRIALESLKRKTEWNDAVGAADAMTQSQIAELPNQGWIVDGQGRAVSPSTQALSILNAWRTKPEVGMLPFGAKQTEVKKPDALKVEEAKQKGRKDIEALRQENRLEMEQFKQDNRVELMETADKYRRDLESFKSQLREEQKKKAVSEDEFINRHFNVIYSKLTKDDDVPAMRAAKMATSLLSATYKGLKTEEKPTKKEAAPPAATAAPTPTPSPATNAPPAKKVLKWNPDTEQLE